MVSSYHHHHHRISVMELGHLLTHSGLTYPEVSSKVYHSSFCQLGSSVSLPWVINFEAFYLHVISSFSCIPVICPKFVFFLTPLQFVHLFCNLFEENLSGFFPWDFPVVKIFPEWVTGPEQGKSSATFSLWTGMFRDGISSIPGETVIPLWHGRHFLVCENRVYHEKVRMTVG